MVTQASETSNLFSFVKAKEKGQKALNGIPQGIPRDIDNTGPCF